MELFPNLRKPINLGKVQLKNRLVMAPTQTDYGDVGGFVSKLMLEFYSRQAKGGWSLICVDAAFPSRKGILPIKKGLGVAEDAHIPGLSRLAEAIHQNGAKAAIQVVYRAATGSLADTVRNEPEMLNKMTLSEIEEMIETFPAAAVRAKKAGFDAFLIHAAHAFIFSISLNPRLNHRTDKYGEPWAVCAEAIRRIRQAVGHDMAIGIRITGREFLGKLGLSVEDQIANAPHLQEAGADYLDISAGSIASLNWQTGSVYLPRGCNAKFTGMIKKSVSIPVVAVNRINDPRVGEQILARGEADVIAMCRGALADPDLPNKTFAGKLDEIRKCVACGHPCQRHFAREQVQCAQNYACGRLESDWQLTPTKNPKKVMVVGGGISGMETARVATLRGHDVTLYEKSGQLGGSVKNMASAIPKLNTRDLNNSVTYLVPQMKKLGVKVVLGKEVNLDLIKEALPDIVVLATGSVPYLPSIPGIDKKHVVMLDNYLGEKVALGNRVVVLGGQHGLETAVSLAREGKQVTLVEETRQLGSTPYLYNSWRLEELLEYAEDCGADISGVVAVSEPAAFLRVYRPRPRDLKFPAEGKLTFSLETKITRIEDGHVVVSQAGKKREIEADSVLVALERLPNKSLLQSLSLWLAGSALKTVYEVGDCVLPQTIHHAIHTGYRTGREI